MFYRLIQLSRGAWPLFFFGLLVLGAGVWSSAVISQGDESDYITSSREMYRSGDLITPTLEGEARFTKPPLLYWLINLSYNLFGLSLFSSRLPSVLSGVLLSLGVFRFGSYLYGREAGMVSALLTLTSFGMVKFSKIALMEIPLTLFILLTFYYYLTYLDSGSRRRLWLSSLFLGLVALMKSPAYSVICVVIIALYLAAGNSLRDVFKKEYRWALVIFLAITLPWYLLMFLKHGELFYLYYLNEHMNKFYAERHYILRVWVGLLFYMLPWSFLFLYAVYRVFASGEYLNRKNSFLLLWIGVFLIIFLFPNQKSHYYSIPMVPPAMLLIGGLLSRNSTGETGVIRIITAAIIALLILVLSGAVIILDHSLGLFFSLTILSLFVSLYHTLKGALKKSAIIFGLSVTLFYTLLLPNLSISPLPAPIISSLKQSGKPLFTFRLSPALYADALGLEVNEVREYRSLVDQAPDGGLLIIREADYEKISGAGKVLSVWKRWRRRIPFMEGLRAFKSADGEMLKERVLLVGVPEVFDTVNRSN